MILLLLLTMLIWNYFSVESDSSEMSDEKEKVINIELWLVNPNIVAF